MKRIIVSIAIMAAVLFPLGGCTLPGVGPVDPINPVIPVDPPAPITAAFDYYCDVSPIQTDSFVAFDGSYSSSPDGEIVWGRWDFDDEIVVEGAWVKMVSSWENGIEVWNKISWRREVTHKYADIGTYDVMLTVWDGEGNCDSMTRTVRVRNP